MDAERRLETTKWMIINILAPEKILGKALGDLDHAKRDLKNLQDYAIEDDVPWTMTHSLLANMGGFVVRFNEGTSNTNSKTKTEKASKCLKL